MMLSTHVRTAAAVKRSCVTWLCYVQIRRHQKPGMGVLYLIHVYVILEFFWVSVCLNCEHVQAHKFIDTLASLGYRDQVAQEAVGHVTTGLESIMRRSFLLVLDKNLQ